MSKKNNHLSSLLAAASVEQLEAELRRRRETPSTKEEPEAISLDDYVSWETEHLIDFKVWARVQQNKECEHGLPERMPFVEWMEMFNDASWMEEMFPDEDVEAEAKPEPPAAS